MSSLQHEESNSERTHHSDDDIRDVMDSAQPLLAQAEGGDSDVTIEPEAPSPWLPSSKSKIPMVVYLMFLMVSLELENTVQPVPTVRLYESAICQQYYNRPTHEVECKIAPIQQSLARVRGWQGIFDALPTLFLSIPFGYLADKKGRKLVLFLSEFGEICCLGWILMTCLLWDRLPIQVVWLNALFRIIGGGPNVAFAVLLTMAADISTSETRSRTFYIIFCSMLCIAALGPTIALATLEYSLWLPYLVCAVGLAASFPVLYWMPETLPELDKSKTRNAAYEHSMEGSPKTLRKRFNSTMKIYGVVLHDRRMLAGLLCVFLAQFRSVAIDVLLPYVSYRFDWALSKTAVLITVIYAVNIVVFLVILPLATTKLKKVTTLPTTGIDLLVARISLGLLATGILVVGIANSIVTMFIGLAIFAAGFGARISMVSVITGFTTATYRARLYALLSIIEELTRLTGTPLIQNAWAKGIELGGQRLGLPFWILAAFFSIACATAVTVLHSKNLGMSAAAAKTLEEEQSGD